MWENVIALSDHKVIQLYTEVNYTCSPGYILPDHDNFSLTTCGIDGEWEPPFKQCGKYF